MLLRAVPIGHHRLETGPVGGTHFDNDPFAHAPSLLDRYTVSITKWTHPSDFNH